MLQQILKDMYIDPELLAELDEEQKQVLFCKIREEQIRRWQEKETKLEKDEKKNKKPKPPSKNGSKTVNWLLGNDQNIWVWVMGEHEKDKSIETILEDEEHRKAAILAEKESEALALKAEKERQEEERKRQEVEEQEQLKQIQVRHERRRRKSIDEINLMKERRSSEIYMSFKESRQTQAKLAEQDSKEIDEEWQEQEKKSKAADKEIRDIARRARAEHRRSIRDSMSPQPRPEIKEKPPIPNNYQKYLCDEAEERPASLKLGRPAKPPNRKAIVDWFKEVEEPKGSGRNPITKEVEPWFHGIITRQDAEDLLEKEDIGTFLVRVSERIWGYAVSYKGPSRCKHFLIDTAGGNYQFFGTHQIAHAQLADLVNFHKVTPISCAGQEKLICPSTQKGDPPNYKDLFD